ncbi:hypothetical protein DC522_03170 [Microvirga sp. KLBC 81]|uniref:DUF429 domain-containing protein n=1 Tax=Microvirga sp. KLBC 81 TaxID=1862707 RepID=UPI000D510FBA|nr:DUF429 domain-containing protein [Microvirga sp. KLBC 81]PVE25788.1 hypothetical protein DC522_03170 [Microvirga sp. KLBC 81]
MGVMKEVLIGFDSAWTDNTKNPGAIAAYVVEDGVPTEFHAPRLASFREAEELVKELTQNHTYALVVIDQPTIVPNVEGCRPVERVAMSLVNALGGGVQPARRGGGGAGMFGDQAPIWRFLRNINGTQNPFEARTAASGFYVMEVFPALALPALVPELWERGRGAKYNPAARTFRIEDWRLVASGVARYASQLGVLSLSSWADAEVTRAKPKKEDQDRMDAAICLLVAYGWRHGPRERGMVVGDPATGYVATIASTATREVLLKSASDRGVPVDVPWSGNGLPIMTEPPEPFVPASVIETFVREEKNQANPSRPTRKKPTRLNPDDLRAFLISRAQKAQIVTYGEVADAFGHAWSQGFGSSLKSALRVVSETNARNGEPQLMCLIVNKESRLPGDGFFESAGFTSHDKDHKEEFLRGELARCCKWNWDSD